MKRSKNPLTVIKDGKVLGILESYTIESIIEPIDPYQVIPVEIITSQSRTITVNGTDFKIHDWVLKGNKLKVKGRRK